MDLVQLGPPGQAAEVANTPDVGQAQQKAEEKRRLEIAKEAQQDLKRVTEERALAQRAKKEQTDLQHFAAFQSGAYEEAKNGEFGTTHAATPDTQQQTDSLPSCQVQCALRSRCALLTPLLIRKQRRPNISPLSTPLLACMLFVNSMLSILRNSNLFVLPGEPHCGSLCLVHWLDLPTPSGLLG